MPRTALLTATLMFSATAAAFAETPCERLKSLSLANAAITVAESRIVKIFSRASTGCSDMA
jgi:hypothetical protein